MKLGDTNGYPTCSGLSPPPFSHLQSLSGAHSHCHTPPEIQVIFLFLFPQASGLQMLTVACQNTPDLPRREETLPSSRSLWEGTAPRAQGTRAPLRKQIRALVAKATHHPPADLAPELDIRLAPPTYTRPWAPGDPLPIPAPPFLPQLPTP